MSRCSIIMPVHNCASLTRQCLNALLAHTPENRPEIIVVDDASTDVTPSFLAGYGDQIRVLKHVTNTGFATACNDGANIASSEYLIFLNNDTIPKAGWLDALVPHADAHPRAAVVGCKLLYPDDTIQHAGMVVCQDRSPRHIYRGFPADHPAVNKSRRFQMVTGASMLIRRELFHQVGGFDATFVNGYEDVDLCLRLGERGHEIHYCHESVLYHLESVTGGRLEHDEDNSRLYRDRWAYRVQPDDLHYYVEDGLLNIRYEVQYPVGFTVSPLLAVTTGDEDEPQIEQLLTARSRQVFELLKENTQLHVRLREAELRAAVTSNNSPGRLVATTPLNRDAEPRLLFRGKVHSLSNESSSRLISLMVPTKNGAAHLRESLPRVLSQRANDNLEIIAVDSGSDDDTLDVLREFQATVVSIDPQSFNHGLTRNLAARYARGHVFVFVNQDTFPANDQWLVNLVEPLYGNPEIAGVCSRVLPREDADLLTYRDGLRELSATAQRSVRGITDWKEYRAFSHQRLRQFINFHTVSSAIRPEVFARIPFRETTTIGEDNRWAKEVLEAGFGIQHEPLSIVLHSHNYSYLEVLRRNVDDGIANRKHVGRRLDDSEVISSIISLARDDWRYLEEQCELDSAELEHWRLASVLRRTAQVVGQWIGLNQYRITGDAISFLSLTEQFKFGVDRRSRVEAI